MSDERRRVLFYGESDVLSPASSAGKFTCKFVVTSMADKLYLLIGPLSDYPYHAALLDRFCREQNIPSEWAQRPDLLELLDEDSKVCGGGYMEIDPNSRAIRVGGRSKAYGEFNRADVNQAVEGQPIFSGFSWTFE